MILADTRYGRRFWFSCPLTQINVRVMCILHSIV